MTLHGILSILIIGLFSIAIAWPLGIYLYHVYEGKPTLIHRVLEPVEVLTYKFINIDPGREMTWKEYVANIILFNAIGFVIVYLVLVYQNWLPFNPEHFPGVNPYTAFNTAISFVTNTNWQSYTGEQTLSYTSQIALTFEQIVSPITGICFLLMFIRGIRRIESKTVGNFYVDFVRTFVYLAVPVMTIAAILLVGLGVPQNFNHYMNITTLDGGRQVIPGGPVASMTAAMQFGDNGGGFFGANTAYPFEAPGVRALIFQAILGMWVPLALVFMFGKMVSNKKHALTLLAIMVGVYFIGAFVLYGAEAAGNPLIAHVIGISGPNWEGKDTRFGISLSSFFENTTTAVSWGATAAANDSLTPIGGLVTLFNMLTGEVIIGAWGVGLLGMLAYVIIAIFLAGLMVGRTPEYFGKKIQSYEMKMAALSMLIPSFTILVFTSIALSVPEGRQGILNPGPHGLSEVLYAFASSVGNNGSAFGGLNAGLPLYNVLTGIAMIIGRFAMYIPLAAIAGSMATKKSVPPTSGTFPTHGFTFGVLVVGTVMIVSALVFFPVLALGPLAEQFSMMAGKLF